MKTEILNYNVLERFFLLVITASVIIVILASGFLGYQIFSILNFDDLEDQGKGLIGKDESSPDITPTFLNNPFNNYSNNSYRGPNGGKGHAGGQGNPFLGYRLFNLGNGLSIWSNQVPLSLQNSYFQGTVRMSLYKFDTKIMEFDINFDKDVDLISFFSDVNFTERKSFINLIENLMFNIDIYVPKGDNFTQIRICDNVTRFSQIREGCGSESGINETIFTLLDNNFEIYEEYFILRNSSLKNVGVIAELDSVSPIVNLNYPYENYLDLDGNISFEFNALDAAGVGFCDLNLNGNRQRRIENISNLHNYTLEIQNISNGNYHWNINCFDIHNNSRLSNNRVMTVIPVTNFSGSTTNLIGMNISNVSNFTIDNPLEGKINFLDNLDLSSGPNINEYVHIEDNNISIFSEHIPELNKSAVITFYNISYENPIILRDGQNCTECRIIPSNEGFSFIVNHFSSYSVFGANVTVINTSTGVSGPADNVTAYSGNITSLIIRGLSNTQSWQGYYGNVSGTIQLADSNDNIFYNWTLANPSGEVYASTNSTIEWGNIQCFNFTANGTLSFGGEIPGETNFGGLNLTQLESRFNILSSDVDGLNETFYLNDHDLFYTSSLQFSANECKSTRVYGFSGPTDQQFEEVLLYEPFTRSVIFASLIDENGNTAFNGENSDFEMLVLEDGHGADVSATTYFFYVELE